MKVLREKREVEIEIRNSTLGRYFVNIGKPGLLYESLHLPS